MIICPKCQYDNDLGRIFCAKCGEKLDITKVKAPTSVRKRPKGEKHRSFQKIVSDFTAKLIKVAILAAVACVLTLLAAPPVFQRKDFNASDVISFEEKRGQLEDSQTSEQKKQIVFKEEELNAALSQAIYNTTATQAADPNAIKLETMYLGFQEGTVRVTIANKWRWFRLNLQEQSTPVQENGVWTLQPTAFWIGRLRLPPALNSYVNQLYFSRLWASFVNEKTLIEKLTGLELKPGQAVLTTKG